MTEAPTGSSHDPIARLIGDLMMDNIRLGVAIQEHDVAGLRTLGVSIGERSAHLADVFEHEQSMGCGDHG